MGVDVVIGGQAGDEGKGKIAQYLASKGKYDLITRISVPQAGHSVIYKGRKIGLATLPTGFMYKKSRLLIGRGAFLSEEKFFDELNKTGLTDNYERVGIDNYTTIVTPRHKQLENEDRHLMGNIGSVGTGTGYARMDKLKRVEDLVFAKDVPSLKPYLTDTSKEMNEIVINGGNVLLEGDHGFKLSLMHQEYPCVTTRDTTASTLVGEAWLPPQSVDRVYLIFKPYVTRVAAGPMINEITNEKRLEWFEEVGGEKGTVSKRKRRIGEFDWEDAKRAIEVNGATDLAITHIDVFKDDREKGNFETRVEAELCTPYKEVYGTKISLLSHGPRLKDIKDLRKCA